LHQRLGPAYSKREIKKKASRDFALVSYIILFRNWPVTLNGLHLYITARSISADRIEEGVKFLSGGRRSSVLTVFDKMEPHRLEICKMECNDIFIKYVFRVFQPFCPRKSANVSERDSPKKSERPKPFTHSN
jgi:hypothetical protein